MAKAPQSGKSAAVAQAKKSGGVGGYFKGVKKEMSKVVWPTKKELGSYAVVVVATCAICAVGFWLIDSGVLLSLQKILGVTMN